MWIMSLHMRLLIIPLLVCSVYGKRNKQMSLPRSLYCGKQFEIDGATVKSDSSPSSLYKNSACIVKFKADDKKLLVNLTDVHIRTCPSKLSVYFDDDSYGTPDHVIDCDHPTPGVVMSTGKYVTIRQDGIIGRPDAFNIILTSYHTSLFDCEFKCRNGYCIDRDLECDRIDHCSDNSDEDVCWHSQTDDFEEMHADFKSAATLGVAVIIGIIVAIIVICVACCVGIICCCKRRQGFKGRVLRGPASQATTTTIVPPPPAAQPLMPMQGPGQPAQPGAYPPPQPSGYQPMPQPQQPYPQPAQYPVAVPPPYQEKEGPYPPPPPVQQQIQQSSAPGSLMPSAPPSV